MQESQPKKGKKGKKIVMWLVYMCNWIKIKWQYFEYICKLMF